MYLSIQHRYRARDIQKIVDLSYIRLFVVTEFNFATKKMSRMSSETVLQHPSVIIHSGT